MPATLAAKAFSLVVNDGRWSWSRPVTLGSTVNETGAYAFRGGQGWLGSMASAALAVGRATEVVVAASRAALGPGGAAKRTRSASDPPHAAENPPHSMTRIRGAQKTPAD